MEINHRFENASKHAAKISEAAKALDLAIHLAARDGYHAKVRVTGHRSADGAFIGTGYGTDKEVVGIKATIMFDIGEAI